jgi:putative membrane protein
MYYGYENMMGMHAFWWFFWVAVIIAWAIWFRDASPTNQRRARETPHEVLRRRLASGEISTEEYEKRKVLLDRDQDAISA